MNPALRNLIEECIWWGTALEGSVASATACRGGSINLAQTLELVDGRKFFLKTNDAKLPGMFSAETAGLRALAAGGAIRVPHVFGAVDRAKEYSAFLLLEYIEPGQPGPDFMARFGAQLAAMHRATAKPRAGFDVDNYIGATPQANGWMDDWVEFWRERRLGPQLLLARSKGLADARMTALGDKMMARLDELIGEPDEPMCLLHGDLWGGNYLCDENGDAVLIDPAAYYGRREADLAMTQLFGGFTPEFYAGYESIWPLDEGNAKRMEVYKLYHLLNHLNLFGGGYYDSCMAILQRFA